jgi:predicted phage terminase large subunit-like protein
MNLDKITTLSKAEIEALMRALPSMSVQDKMELFEDLEIRERRASLNAAQNNMLGFASAVYPGFKIGPQHRKLAKIFTDVIEGRKKRVIINIAPRMGKSEFSSYLFPAYFLGKYPDKKIIMGTHTAGLSEDFGRRVRNLLDTEEYRAVFPDTRVASDQKAAGKWSTSAGGQYYAAGVGGALAGRGADLFVIDDPHALTLDTLIPTPLGFKTIEELAIGDEVFGPDGVPTRVLAKSDVWHNRPLYEVETDDGEVIHCDGGHLWTFHSETALAKSHLTKTLTTRELAEWDKPNRPCLPRHSAVQYPHADLPIDPYVLGAWLGDGTASSAKITSHPDDQPFMRAQFEAAGYKTTDQNDPYNFGVLGLWPVLKDMYLLGNKHIPQAYLTASVEQRMALLQGLMDTDGTVTTAGQCSFQNTNERLVQEVRELLHSLGHKCRVCVYYDNRERHISRQPDYRLNFKMAGAFRMPRKAQRAFTSEDKRRRTFAVRPTQRTGSVQCITVDREDGLFLAGRGYVVTHNSEQDVKVNSRLAFDTAWSWFQTGPLQRLMPGGAIIIVMTRWSLLDLTGRLITYQSKNPDSIPWEIVELPAILNEGDDNEKSLWPEQWPLETLKATKASIEPRYWNAQYMQQPTSENSALVSRKHWRIWESSTPPRCEYVLQSWDTAHEVKNTSDYSACTTWGVFYNEEEGDSPQVILLDAFKDRMTFPELKQVALKHYKDWEPDAFIVEKKAAGGPLIQELRSMGIPVQEFSPSRGNDKMVRLNAVADLFTSGKVWAPDTRWAQEVIEEIASFPVGENDDYVDTTTQALLRYRQGGFISLDTDEQDDPYRYARRPTAYY